MLIGNLHGDDELTLFDFLWEVERRVMIDDTDVLGCAKDTVFSIEIEPGSKPVCHDVRRCSR